MRRRSKENHAADEFAKPMISTRPLSIVMPLFNKRPFVRASVESVLAQVHRAFELIVVDDGSTDGSAGALGDLADPRLRLIVQPNQGVAAARNRGIAEARHDWIVLLDADDQWRPEHLTTIAAMAGTHPDAGIVAAAVQQVRGGRRVEADRTGPFTVREIDYFAEAARDILVVHTSATALRRAAVSQIGGFRNLRPGQDIDCWSRMALRWPVVVTDRQTAFYMRDTDGAMAQWGSRGSRSDIGTLKDFGGAIESLADALESGLHDSRRKGIEQYIDARILSGVGKCIASGDLANARRRLDFVRGRSSPRYLAYRVLAGLPHDLVRSAIEIVRTLRRRARR